MNPCNFLPRELSVAAEIIMLKSLVFKITENAKRGVGYSRNMQFAWDGLAAIEVAEAVAYGTIEIPEEVMGKQVPTPDNPSPLWVPGMPR
jgi:hypothetical protein